MQKTPSFCPSKKLFDETFGKSFLDLGAGHLSQKDHASALLLADS